MGAAKLRLVIVYPDITPIRPSGTTTGLNPVGFRHLGPDPSLARNREPKLTHQLESHVYPPP